MEGAVVWFTEYGCKNLQIKAESLHFIHIKIVLFQLFAEVQTKDNKKCVSVKIITDCTVNEGTHSQHELSLCTN